MAATSVTGPSVAPLETGDMQGLVARAYGNLPVSRYILCRIGDPAAARAWLGAIAGDIFTADRPSDDGPCFNLALTWEGVRRLGLPDDALTTFPRALQEGMVTDHRSRVLGDVGDSAPTQWRWGRPGANTDAIHVLVMLFAMTPAALDAEHASRRAGYQATGALVEVGESIEGNLVGTEGREHFGFADGLSQPLVKGWPASGQGSVRPAAPAVPAKFAEVEPGEILLGYDDNFGKPAEGPTVTDSDSARLLPKASWTKGRRDLGRNGSYLVLRQLAQDVVGFRRSIDAASQASAARGTPITPERVGAKTVGRWASGAPVVLYPDSDPGEVGSNDFGYHDKDQAGMNCPLGAHVRRSNPRDSSEDQPVEALSSSRNHRILRRGRPYGQAIVDPPTAPGEEESAERGLVFICLNTDIERQFEFVQHTWLNNPVFEGLDGEIDPVAGMPTIEGADFTVPAAPVRHKMACLGGFVTTRGGAYFFLPGIKALGYLSGMGG